MNHEIIYDTIEILSTDRGALCQAAKDGYTQYGVSRDLRQDHPSFLKLRRAVEKGKK
jgi:hypothetical protein